MDSLEYLIALVPISPNSIRSILLEACSKPGFRPSFKQVLSRSQTSRRQVGDQKKSQACRKRDRSITTCRDKSSRFSTFLTTFYCLKQVLSKIEAMEFRNDFSRQSTNRKLARSGVINDVFYCDWKWLPRIFFYLLMQKMLLIVHITKLFCGIRLLTVPKRKMNWHGDSLDSQPHYV